jgi:orotate phosphoribosyltransferase-like protein
VKIEAKGSFGVLLIFSINSLNGASFTAKVKLVPDELDKHPIVCQLLHDVQKVNQITGEPVHAMTTVSPFLT